MLFGAGMLVSLLSFLILLSAFASNRVDDGISLRMGLDRHAPRIMTTSSRPHRPRRTAALHQRALRHRRHARGGRLTPADLREVFHQEHRGRRRLYRLLIWLAVPCLTAVPDTLVGRPVRNASDRAVPAVLVTFAIWTPFFWWTMHFLPAGRVPWRRLLPSAILTGVFFVGPGCSRSVGGT